MSRLTAEEIRESFDLALSDSSSENEIDLIEERIVTEDDELKAEDNDPYIEYNTPFISRSQTVDMVDHVQDDAQELLGRKNKSKQIPD